MRCPFCNKENPDGAKFCGGCGKNLEQTNFPGKDSDQKSVIPEGVNPNSGKAPKKKRKFKFLFTILAVVITAFIGVCFFAFKEDKTDVNSAGSTVSYDNGDVIYMPAEEDLAYDEDENIIYYDNLLIVYLVSDMDEDSAIELAEIVNGTVVGDISGAVNVLQIQVESTDLSALNVYAETLMESEDVIYATYDFPMFISETSEDENPWSDTGEVIEDKGNEDDPDGNDWWVEAIGAYTAWDITDELDLSGISVGIIDSGFDLDHEDLTDNISLLAGYDTNSESDHGTHVTGIIGADNNAVGIRGIADSANLLCADRTPESGVNYTNSGEYIEIIKQMIESDVRVINNSWTYQLFSEDAWAEDEYGWSAWISDLFGIVDITTEYESYIEELETACENSAITCMMLIYQLEISGYNDFIIVQGAGNGYTTTGNSGPGVDASEYAGFFCSIDEELFDDVRSFIGTFSTGTQFEQYAYEDIKDHIIIVGAVQNEQDIDGNYSMSYYSNYGETVDICAPGSKIYSTLTTLDDDEDDDDENDGLIYGNLSGTSMAAPMVTGAAALLWQMNPDLSSDEVKALLTDNCIVNAVDEETGYSYPMLNIGAAVEVLADEMGITDETAVMYQLYYDKLMELQEEYGEAQFLSGEYEYASGAVDTVYYWSGLCFASLVDFDSDGQEELITAVYNGPEETETDWYDDDTYIIQVWAYENGSIQEVYCQGIFYFSDWELGCLIEEIDSMYYIVDGYSSGAGYLNEYYGYQNGVFTLIKSFDVFGSTEGWLIDGAEVSDEEYMEVSNEWGENISQSLLYYFAYFEGYESADMLDPEDELENTLAYLMEYLGISAEEDEDEADSADDEYEGIGESEDSADSAEGEAFAVFSYDDYSLRFYRDTTIPEEGDTYNGLTVDKTYTDFETKEYKEPMIPNRIPWCGIATLVRTVIFEDVISPVSCKYWFIHFDDCEYMDLEKLDTSNVVKMSNMFYGCSSLVSLDLSHFDTSNVQYMDDMFHDCSSLISLDLSGFDTSQVVSMEWMFYGCSSLEILDLSSFDVSNLEEAYIMFKGCSSLVTIYASNWTDESNFDSRQTMFGDNYALVGAISFEENSVSDKYANYETGYFTKK